MTHTDQLIFSVQEYCPQFAHQIVGLWRASKRSALGNYQEPYEFSDMLHYLTTVMVKDHTIKVALNASESKVIGFMALREGVIAQLYVHVGYKGRGVGARLLNIAKSLSPKKLELHTFEMNKPAVVFYEKHGFRTVAFGSDNEEGLPDLLMQWLGGDLITPSTQ